jgi:glyoxylase-like metal-dependent hydrolase (beta-lactamase superfamily II)
VRIHHLSCGAFRPLGIPFGLCHVLALEHAGGVALVDAGFGTADLTAPGRLGPATRRFGLRLDPEQSALRQLERLGIAASQVHDIVLTHLDFDHVGGLADFPAAQVHTTADEWAAVTAPAPGEERDAYLPVTLAHGPRVRTYAGPGEPWRAGLTAHAVAGLPGVHLVPMPGHTRGHALVAVDLPDGGLLVHAGDAAFDASSYVARAADGRRLRPAPLLRLVERLQGMDLAAVPRNHTALARLAAEDGVRVVTAHDPRTFARPAAD